MVVERMREGGGKSQYEQVLDDTTILSHMNEQKQKMVDASGDECPRPRLPLSACVCERESELYETTSRRGRNVNVSPTPMMERGSRRPHATWIRRIINLPRQPLIVRHTSSSSSSPSPSYSLRYSGKIFPPLPQLAYL